MKFSQLQPLILHNLQRTFRANGVAWAYFDPQELDSTLTHGENLHNVLAARGLRTRADWRATMARWRGQAREMEVICAQ